MQRLPRSISQLAGEDDIASKVRDIFSISEQPEDRDTYIIISLLSGYMVNAVEIIKVACRARDSFSVSEQPKGRDTYFSHLPFKKSFDFNFYFRINIYLCPATSLCMKHLFQWYKLFLVVYPKIV